MPSTYRKKYKGKHRKSKREYSRNKSGVMTRWGHSTYNIHQYKRYGRGWSLSLSNNVSGFNSDAFSFDFEHITNYQELQTIYDQYKIDMVQLRISWSPKLTLGANVNAPGQSTYPLMYYYKDYDDEAVPTSLASMKERGNLRQIRITPNKIIKINIKPSVLTEVKTVGGASANKPTWGSIIDMGNGAVPHFGLKIGLDHLPNFDQGAIDIELIYFITCYGTR